MYKFGVIYNDIAYDNILINKLNKKFYLFDFDLIYFIDIDGQKLLQQTEDKIFKGNLHLIPPSSWYYLFTKEKRLKFRENHKEYDDEKVTDIFIEYGYYQSKYAFTSMILHGIIKYFCIYYKSKCESLLFDVYDVNLMELNEGLLLFLRMPYKNPQNFTFKDWDTLYQNVWCKRYLMIKRLRDENKKEDIFKEIIRDDIKHKFWKSILIFNDDIYYLNHSICITT